MAPNGSKWLEMTPKGSKWFSMTPNNSKWIVMTKKLTQIAQNGSKLFKMA